VTSQTLIKPKNSTEAVEFVKESEALPIQLTNGKRHPCIRLARGKFELTNQDLAGGKNSSVLTPS